MVKAPLVDRLRQPVLMSPYGWDRVLAERAEAAVTILRLLDIAKRSMALAKQAVAERAKRAVT